MGQGVRCIVLRVLKLPFELYLLYFMNSEFTAEFLVVSSLLSPTLCPLLSEKVGIELHLYQAESSRNSGSSQDSDAKVQRASDR